MYTQVLSKNLLKGGLSIEQVFKNVRGEVLEKSKSRKESDLRGHLKEDKKKQPSKAINNDNNDENISSEITDYQLNRAIELIRSISVYESLKKASS